MFQNGANIRTLLKHFFDSIIRVIGYLKKVSSFSNTRQAEEELRYYHKKPQSIFKIGGETSISTISCFLAIPRCIGSTYVMTVIKKVA